MCWEDKENADPEEHKHRRIGKLIYYRTHEAQLRLDLIPAKAWASSSGWFIGNFIESEDVPEPPYIDGDLIATTEDRGDYVVAGHIHTRERDDGAVQYYMKLFGIPVREWIKIRDSNKESKSIYLKVNL
jgi:hypothetical protein